MLSRCVIDMSFIDKAGSRRKSIIMFHYHYLRVFFPESRVNALKACREKQKKIILTTNKKREEKKTEFFPFDHQLFRGYFLQINAKKQGKAHKKDPHYQQNSKQTKKTEFLPIEL